MSITKIKTIKEMKTMKQTFWFFMMLTALTLAACSSDDDDNNNGTGDDDAVELARIQEQIQANLMMKALCEYDSTTASYKPSIGEAINAPTPTIYYAIANSVEQARSRYENIVSFLRTEITADSTKVADPDETSDPLPTDVTRGDIHVSFAASSADGEVARINVDCPRLANVLTAIVFIPETAWPENDVVNPFNYLSCWREKTTGRIYICVQECKGGKGIMLTLDGGWEEDWFKAYDHWQGQFYLWKSTASYDAFRGLSDAWKYSRDKLNYMNAALQRSYPNTTTAKYMRNFMGSYAYIWNTDFDYEVSYDHHLWWAYNCWDVTVKRLCFYYKSHGIYTWSSSYTHKEVPARENPSHSFDFDRGYKKDNNVWEAIYK